MKQQTAAIRVSAMSSSSRRRQEVSLTQGSCDIRTMAQLLVRGPLYNIITTNVLPSTVHDLSIVMKAFVVIALLCLGGAQAGILDDLAAATTAALDGILSTAQTAAQELLDTYVPVLGQAAQQLVGEAVSNLGDSLTGLVTGKRKRQEFQTEIGQIINDGIQALLEHTTTAVQNVQTALTGTIDALFGSPDPAAAIATTKRALKKNSLKAKSLISQTNRKMKAMVVKKVSRDFFSDLASGVSTIFQPVIDQAALAFNQLVDAATAVGAQVVDHGTTLINNLTTTVQDTVKHRRPMRVFHCTRLWAFLLRSCQLLFMPLISTSVSLLQLVFGRPLLLLPWGFQGQSSSATRTTLSAQKRLSSIAFSNDSEGQVSGVVQPYVDDATNIIGSIQNHFQNTFGADTTA
ncbi:Hypp5489 [Branchiostoma lanceolatum]|uniref:Hypp5489 protein n=1 Tax=Branchiostoma lanceolatum TaxID=7740 RepID=A0A8J9YL37_BRALA|nr:Hypp5489 [Branchiostoma lanceolatum]